MSPDKLLDRINSMFTACVGPARAYFEVGVGARVVYSTLRVCMVGEPELVGPTLCDWAYARFRALLTEEQREDAAFTLFWRTLPNLQGFSNEHGQLCTALHMRFAIPQIEDLQRRLPIKNEGSVEILWL